MTIKEWLKKRMDFEFGSLPSATMKANGFDDWKAMHYCWLETMPGLAKYGDIDLVEAKREKGFRGRLQWRFETLQGVYRLYGGHSRFPVGRLSKSGK